MQQWFTWEQFLGYMIFCLAAYVVIIVIIYYKAELRNMLAGRNKISPANNRQVTPVDSSASSDRASHANHSHTLVHELLEELKKVFAAARSENLSREQVMEAVGYRFEKYRALAGSALQHSVDEHVTREFFLQLNMTITIEEINALW